MSITPGIRNAPCRSTPPGTLCDRISVICPSSRTTVPFTSLPGHTMRALVKIVSVMGFIRATLRLDSSFYDLKGLGEDAAAHPVRDAFHRGDHDYDHDRVRHNVPV